MKKQDFKVGNCVVSYNKTGKSATIITPDLLQHHIEFKALRVLEMLSKNIGHVIHREDCLLSIWGDATHWTGRSMDVYIAKLRKIFKTGTNVSIVNVSGVGFELVIKDNFQN